MSLVPKQIDSPSHHIYQVLSGVHCTLSYNKILEGKIEYTIMLNQILIGDDSNVAYLFWTDTYVWHFLAADSAVKCWQTRSSKT